MGNRIYNNERLRRIAGSVNGEALSDRRLLNNDYLRMIEEGIGGLTPGSGGYRDGGSISAGGLTSSLLTGDNVGTIYNVSGEIAVTSANQALFVDATAGETFPEGTNVRVVERDGSYLFDVFAGFVGIPDVTADPTGAADSGLMSSTDKSKLDGVEAGANAYVLPPATTDALGGVMVDGSTIYADADGTIHGGITAESDGSTAGSLLSLTAKGHAEQDATTGKNLLPNNATSQTSNGVTFTVNADGSITANGTATQLIGRNISPTLNLSGTYTLSGCPKNGGIDSYQLDSSGAYPDTGNGNTFTIDGSLQIRIRIASGYTCNNLTFYPQLELGSTATSYEPYTGGAPSPSPDYPQEIRVARGRNLVFKTLSGRNIASNGSFESDSSFDMHVAAVHKGDTYTATTSTNALVYGFFASEPVASSVSYDNQRVISISTTTFTAPIDGYVAFRSDAGYATPQLERGSVAHGYVPYGNYVGLEVTHDGTTTTTPIPLPSRGWAGSLPDGTCDTLTLDGAGKATWRKGTNEVVLDGDENLQNHGAGITGDSAGTSNRYAVKNTTLNVPLPKYNAQLSNHFINESTDGSYGSFIFNSDGWLVFFDRYNATTLADFKSWLSTHPVTVLYPLATPVTEECGYVDLPDIPDGASVSIPELDDLGVRYCVDDAASELARMWYGKMRYEHDLDVVSINGTIDEIEDGVVELAGQVVTHEGRLSSVEGRLDAMQSLVRGADGYYVNESVTAFLAANFDGKLYGYSEPKTTAVSVTKTGANAGIANPTLGTATTSGSSAYRHRGPFQWHAAKGHVDADGVPHVRVIRGVDTDEDWEACDENVWSLRPVVWYKMDSSGTAVLGQVSDTWHYGLEPNPQAYLPDGTLRPYMLAPRYALGFEDGVGVSKSGLKGYGRDVSHNSLIEQLDYANSGYSGKTIYELWYDAFMSRMIYGTKDFQTVMQGCTQYNLQYNPTVAETGVKRVILSNANAANLVVGSTMMLGDQSTANTDRGNVNAYNVFDGLVIGSITTYDANNKAVNFVTDTTFDTATTYLLSTAPWHSGSCDAMDWDGSPTDPQSAKEVAFFQGCEILHGATEVLAGVILKGQADARQVPYVTYDTRDDATSITSDFVKCGDGLLSNTGSSNAWKYPLYLADHGGLVYGEGTGGSTTAGLTDSQYVRPDSSATDSEWLSSGYLGHGRYDGPACVVGGHGVSDAWWYIWSRLSGAGRSRG